MRPARDMTALIACPVCRGTLSDAEKELRCQSCGRTFDKVGGVPILLHPDSPFLSGSTRSEPSGHGGLRQALRRRLPSNLAMTTWIDKGIFEFLGRLTPEMTILNLGSGQGTFDRYVPSGLQLINLDVSLSERADLVADGHYLPFRDASLDAVFSNAVLEHVERPWIVADEIWRVLKPGGWALINVPFLNVIHDTNDYFRYTDKGLRVLFSRFDQLAAGVSAGPSSFLGPFLIEYVSCFVPTRPLKMVTRQVVSLLVWPLKYADFLIRRSPNLRITADGFYFVGVKR